MRNYSTCMSRTIAHIRLHIDELSAFTVCDLRVDVGGLFVLRDFLENTVVYSCKVVLPVVDIEAKISSIRARWNSRCQGRHSRS